jgi:hypothetical protein
VEINRGLVFRAVTKDGRLEADALIPESAEIKRALYAAGAPKTMEGRRVFARAALASAGRRSGGCIMPGDGESVDVHVLAHSMAVEDGA